MKKCIVLIIIVYAILAGCSGNTDSPVTTSGTPSSSDIIPLIGMESLADGAFHSLGLLGGYELSLNPDELSAELVSKRYPTLGQSWIVSGIGFFTLTPCSDCLKIKSIALIGNRNLEITYKVSHPFPPGNPTKPPTAINRLDLDIFDLAILLDSTQGDVQYPLMGTTVNTDFLINADGYTTELSNVLGKNEALPYTLVVDDNEAGSLTYNEFPMGGNALASCQIHIGGPMGDTVYFDLYLTMGYGASAQGKSQRLTPTYFNPEFNRKSAWKIEITPPEGSNPPALGNTWQDNDNTTPRTVTVSVYDWQQGNTSIANPPVNPTDIAAASNVVKAIVEIPGMTSTLPEATSPTGGTGSPTDPLIYEIPVINQNLLAAGEYIGLVKVVDERIPQPIPPTGTFDFLIDSPNGITLANYAIPEFSTYQTFIATVVSSCGPITGQINSPNCPIGDLYNNDTVNFTVNATSANGGNPIVLYEVDEDYDGSTFTADDSSATGIFNDVGPFTVPDPCENNIPETWTVAFRAIDSCNPPNVTIFATCEVTVENCNDPLKNIPLRDGVDVYDLGLNAQNGDLIILYSDGDVFRYRNSNNYQTPIPSTVFYDTAWESYSTITFTRGYVAYAGNGNFGVVFASGTHVSPYIYRNMIDIVDSTGTLIRRNNPRGNWSYTYPTMEIIAWGNSGSWANYIGDVWYTSVPNYNYVSVYYPTAYSAERYAYHSRTTDYGYGAIHCGWVRGLEVDDNNNQFWAVETSDYYAARWIVNSWTSGGFVYDNAYFGTGAQDSTDNGFFTPRDLTRTNDNVMLVLDELTGPVFRIKAFDVTSSPGVSVGGMTLTGITGNAKRIDCGEWTDPTLGNSLFVLQYDTATLKGYLSIYRESELPW